MCVATRHFTTALPVLSVPITQIDTSLSDITYNDNLVYHYAGGMALGALKQWRKAEEFFEICVTAPAQTPAAIQLEAYKKLVLVQLIQYGEVRSWDHSCIHRLTAYISSDRPASKIHATGHPAHVQEHRILQLCEVLSLSAPATSPDSYKGARFIPAGTWRSHVTLERRLMPPNRNATSV